MLNSIVNYRLSVAPVFYPYYTDCSSIKFMTHVEGIVCRKLSGAWRLIIQFMDWLSIICFSDRLCISFFLPWVIITKYSIPILISNSNKMIIPYSLDPSPAVAVFISNITVVVISASVHIHD